MAFLLGIFVSSLFSCIRNWDRHDHYNYCKTLWTSQVKPIGIMGYDEETGDPYYIYPNMPTEFKDKCIAKLEKENK